MKIIKQKRDKKGQYQRKHKETIKHLFVFCLVVWTVNVIDFKNLPENKIVIAGTGAPLIINSDEEQGDILPSGSTPTSYPTRQEATSKPNTALSVTTVETEDGGTVTINEDRGRVNDQQVRHDTSSIEGMIAEVFPEDPKTALEVFKCESGFNPYQVGDEHLTFQHNGQIYGRSIGLAQIRTGGIERNGKVWVRSDNVQEFERKMMEPRENLLAAKKIYLGSGWYAWLNCAKKVGAV